MKISVYLSNCKLGRLPLNETEKWPIRNRGRVSTHYGGWPLCCCLLPILVNCFSSTSVDTDGITFGKQGMKENRRFLKCGFLFWGYWIVFPSLNIVSGSLMWYFVLAGWTNVNKFYSHALA